MKTVRLKMVALVLLTSLGFIACNNDDIPPATTKKTFVTNVTGDTTGNINQEIVLNITFGIDNKCGSFNKLIKETTDKTTVFEVEVSYFGLDCGTTASTKMVIYKFKAATSGTYILKFKKSETEFITQTIEIS